MAMLRDLSISVEHTGKRIPIDEVDDSMTARELLVALADKINLPVGTAPTLTRRITRKQILSHQTLAQAGVESGEALIADFDRTAGI